jgi:2-methylcitrate dehydratase PrpD
MALTVDSFIHIIEENRLSPEDIEKIIVTEWEWGITASFPFANKNQLKTKEDICFNVAYLLACAAYKHHPSRWFESEVFQDSKIREFVLKVNKIKERDPELLGIEVVTKSGEIFLTKGGCTGGVCKIDQKEKLIRGGMNFPEEEAKGEMVDKFINNASRILSLQKSNEVMQRVLKLEKLKNVAKLMTMLIP